MRPSLDPGYLRWLWRFRAHCTRERWREGVRALARLNERTIELLDDYAGAGVHFEAYGAGLLLAARTEAKLAADALVGLSAYDRSLRLAGVFELGHHELELDERRLGAMLASADPFFADWRPSREPPSSRWVGLRPLTSDGLPLIGATPRDRHVFVATGHGMLGITLAPATAALLAPLVLEGRTHPALAAFDPARAP